MGVDLSEQRFFLPTYYSIRNIDSVKYVAFNWIFEASLDGTNWHILDKRIHLSQNEKEMLSKKEERKKLLVAGGITTWSVDQRRLK